jgi:hypothetical protein
MATFIFKTGQLQKQGVRLYLNYMFMFMFVFVWSIKIYSPTKLTKSNINIFLLSYKLNPTKKTPSFLTCYSHFTSTKSVSFFLIVLIPIYYDFYAN